MAYIGNPPTVGQWRKLDDISGSFNGATTTFTTSVGGSNVTAGSANQLFVSLGGVIQQPNVDYSVTTNSIIFTTAPTSGLDFFAVLAGDALNAGTPGDGTVTTAKLAGNLTVDLDSGSAAAPSLTFDPDTGLYSPGADQVGISTGGTSRITVDANGNVTFDTSTLYVDATNNRVGVGTTSPTAKLEVSGSAGTNPEIRCADGTVNSQWYAGNDGTCVFGTFSNHPLLFRTNAGERARLDTSGRLLVGTTTSQGSYNLQCYGTGVWGQGAYVNGSDANIKQNIQDLEPALDVIKAMRPVTFQYKQEYSSDQTIQPGFIAQELQAAMAGKAYVDGVVQQGTTHLNVAYSSIIAVLVKAVQELEAKVAALETP